MEANRVHRKDVEFYGGARKRRMQEDGPQESVL